MNDRKDIAEDEVVENRRGRGVGGTGRKVNSTQCRTFGAFLNARLTFFSK
jgi:hypothetical protein